MFILSIIFTELLLLSVIFFRLYYYNQKADCTYSHITIGIGTTLYTKNYNETSFIFKLFPLFVNYDFRSWNYSKLKSINETLVLATQFLIIAIPQSILILIFSGFDMWYIFYKILIIGNGSETEIAILIKQINELWAKPVVFFIIAILSSTLVYIWYILALRAIIDFSLEKLAHLLKFTFNSTNSYLASTAILLYIYFTSNVYLLLMIFKYDSVIINGIFDWLIAHFGLMAVFAFIIEILSRRKQNI